MTTTPTSDADTPGDPLVENLDRIRGAIAAAAARVQRQPDDVTIVAACKTVPSERLRLAASAGIAAFGENYEKDLREKARALPQVRWHYIGTLQSGTAHHVADAADVVQTVSGERATRRLARRAAATGRELEALIEVDLVGGRSGVPPEEVAGFADEVASLDGLRLVGLMTLPPVPEQPEDARPWFARLRELGERLRETHPDVLELSMGMSLDYEVAVEEGATMVRIGTALFGERPRR
jgi:pyridoxal phosphate enzyme (YggS family)